MKNTLKKIVVPLFWILVIIFLAMYLKNIDWGKLVDIDINWAFILIAALVSIGARFWGVHVWLLILKGLGAKGILYSKELIYVYAKAWLGRYIPGTAPWILGKIYFASQHGISKEKLAVSSLLEAALQISTQLILAFILLILDPRLNAVDEYIRNILILSLIICMICVIPPIFNTVLSKIYKIIRKRNLASEHLINFPVLIRGGALYLVTAAEAGITLYLVSIAIGVPVGFNDIWFLIGTSTLAGALGMLAVFVPSGIGVREGILLAMLSLIMPLEYALVITVITRLLSVVTDMLFFGIANLSRRLNSSR